MTGECVWDMLKPTDSSFTADLNQISLPSHGSQSAFCWFNMGKISSTEPQKPTPVQPPTDTHHGLKDHHSKAKENVESIRPYTSMIACNGTRIVPKLDMAILIPQVPSKYPWLLVQRLAAQALWRCMAEVLRELMPIPEHTDERSAP